MKKLSNTEAELKKSVAYKKKRVVEGNEKKIFQRILLVQPLLLICKISIITTNRQLVNGNEKTRCSLLNYMHPLGGTMV